MHRLTVPVTFAAFALALACARTPSTGFSSASASPNGERGRPDVLAERMRGVSWEAGGRVSDDDLRPLVDLGANWISQTPFGWCPDSHTPEIGLETDGRVLWGETDEGLFATAEMARSLGLRTLLKPHLWVRDGTWCGEIEMQSEADWERWFSAYERFIVHYSELAERGRFDALAVGNELPKASVRTMEWRQILARVRSIYSGPITYCANWGEEVARFELWGDLDFIGVNAYWPLSQEPRPARAEITAAWSPIAASLEGIARRFDRRIVFTEAGYRSVRGALVEPWAGPRESTSLREIDVDLQADAWRALFDALAPRAWFGGVFVWKWRPHPRHAGGMDRDYSPQGKPALGVIREAFHGALATKG
jgi:hypothetical protein